MQKILIDTSIIIDFLRQKDKSKTLLYYFSQRQHQLHASIITHAECWAGKSIWEKKEAREILEKLYTNIKILTIDEIISKKAGQVSAEENLDIVDAIIASTAIAYNLKLSTLNVKDFRNIKGLKLAKL